MSEANEAIIFAAEKGYTIDREGNVYSPFGLKLAFKIWDNYYSFGMRFGSAVMRIKVHRFVAYMKFGNELFKENVEVRHLDSNSLNNKWENIGLGSHSVNMLDMPKDKLIKKAINAGSNVRRFSDDEVKQILFDRENGMKYKELTEKYGMPKSSLSYLFNNAYYTGARTIKEN